MADKKCAAELIARCFAARTAGHLAHLSTDSYAAHMALGDFYDAIAGAADEFAECFMGVEGKLRSFPEIEPLGTDPLTWLPELHTWVTDHRTECAAGNTELANLIDEILAVIDRSSYKLKFLK